jgi:hypothetical protein
MAAGKKTAFAVLTAAALYGCSGGGSDTSNNNPPVIPGSSNPPIVNTSTTLSLSSNQPLVLFPEQNAKLILKNSGGSTATDIQISSTNSNVTLSPSQIKSLEPGESSTISLIINADNTGTSPSDQISASGGDTDTATLPFTVIPLTFSQDPLQIGAGDTSTWTLKNQGSSPIKTMNLSFSAPVSTTSDTTCTISLSPNSSCQYVFTAPNDAQSQTGTLSFTADGASINHKTITVVRPTYDISVVELDLGNSPTAPQIAVSPSERTIIQVVNNSPVLIKNLQISLPNISNVSFNNQCSTELPPYNLLPGSSCTIEINPNDNVTQGDQGTLSFSEDNADTANSDYQIIVSSQLPSRPTIQDFYLQTNNMMGTAGVNSAIIAFLNLQTPAQASNQNTPPIPLNLNITNDTSTCNINALNQRNSCGWEATKYQCNPLSNQNQVNSSLAQNSLTQCMIELNYAIPPIPSGGKKTHENFTFLFDNQLPQDLSIIETPGAYLFPKDARDSFNYLPVRAINDISVDNSGRIYLATNAGLLYTSDQGATWKWFSINDGLPTSEIKKLQIDGSTLYLSTPHQIISIDIQEDDPVIQTISPVYPPIEDFISDHGTLYVATYKGAYQVDASGNSQGFPNYVQDRGDAQVDTFSNHNSPYTAILNSGSLIYLFWGGLCFSEYNLTNPVQVNNLYCLDTPLNNEVSIVADTQGHIFFAHYGSLYFSQDAGHNFQGIETLDPFTQTPTSVAAHRDSSEIAVGTTSGLAITQDFGQSWKTAPGTEGTWIKSVYAHDDGSYYLTTMTGISFNHSANGIFSAFVGDTLGNRPDAVSPMNLTPLNLYWTKNSERPETGLRYFRDLFISTNKGLTFNQITPPDVGVSNVYPVTDPLSLQDYVLATSLDARQLLLSDDLGKTWTDITPPGIAAESSHSIIIDAQMCLPKRESGNALNPMDLKSRRILVSTDQALYFSPDSGESWNTRGTGEPFYVTGYLSSNCDQLITSTQSKVQISLDTGKTWPIQFENPAPQPALFLVDSQNHIIIQKYTGQSTGPELWLGTPSDIQTPTSYTWRKINTENFQPDSSIVKIDQDVLYIHNTNQILSIPMATLIQKTTLENGDWDVHSIPLPSREIISFDVLTHSDAQSIEVVGLSRQNGNDVYAFGVNLPTLSAEE